MTARLPSFIKLNYLNGRSRGELIRYILHYAQVPFVDNRIQFEEWPKFKNSMLKTMPMNSSLLIRFSSFSIETSPSP